MIKFKDAAGAWYELPIKNLVTRLIHKRLWVLDTKTNIAYKVDAENYRIVGQAVKRCKS